MNVPSVEIGWILTKDGHAIDAERLNACGFPEDEDECIPIPGTGVGLGETTDQLFLETDPCGSKSFVSYGEFEPTICSTPEPRLLGRLVRKFVKPKGIVAKWGVINTER